MRNKVLLLFLALVLVLVPLFAGCPKPAPPAPPAPPPPPAPWSPTKTITWIVHYAPGGGFDVYSRGIALVMKKYVGVDIVIKNIPGAGGRTGVNALYRAKPDGHTIGMLNVIGLLTTQMIMETKYDMREFEWLGRAAMEVYALAVAADSPFFTVADLQKAAAERPLRVGVPGVETTSAVTSAIALPTLNIPFTYVSGYAGSAEAMVGCLRGDVDIVAYPISSLLPLVESGDLRVVVDYGLERHPAFSPDVPTAKELGYPELATLGLVRLIAAPPGTPKDVVAVLAEALGKTLNDPEFIAWSEKAKRPMDPATAEETEEIVATLFTTFEKYAEAIRAYRE